MSAELSAVINIDEKTDITDEIQSKLNDTQGTMCSKKFQILMGNPWVQSLKTGHWSPENYFERVQHHCENHLTLCGLISGFTYIVATSPPAFTEGSHFISIHNRAQIYGIFSLSAFFLAFTGTIISAALYTQLLQCGVEQITFYNNSFGVFLTHPPKFLVSAIICMLFAVLTAIGGYYSGTAFVILITLAVILMIYFLVVGLIIGGRTRKHLMEGFEKK
eukprot:UN06057